MRKVILQEFVSIDGFAADAQRTTRFFENLKGREAKDIDKDLIKFMSKVDTILLGATTYKMFLKYWPTATTKSEPIADILNATTKIVISKKLKEAPWGKWEPASIDRDPVSAVKDLKKSDGKDIVIWDSMSVAQTLLNAQLIDKVQLRVCPVALGRGVPLFSKNMKALNLKLVESKVYKSGVVLLSYKFDNFAKRKTTRPLKK